MVAVDGRLQTRQWEDEKKARHWKTEIVAAHVEMLSGRRKKDYAAESAAEALAAQAQAMGFSPASAVESDDPDEPDDDDPEATDDVLDRILEPAIA